MAMVIFVIFHHFQDIHYGNMTLTLMLFFLETTQRLAAAIEVSTLPRIYY